MWMLGSILMFTILIVFIFFQQIICTHQLPTHHEESESSIHSSIFPRSAENRSREAKSSVASCIAQEKTDFHSQISNSTFTTQFADNFKSTKINVTWIDDDQILVLITYSSSIPSELYRSIEHGKSFDNVTNLLWGYSILKIYQNPNNKKQVIFVGQESHSSKSVLFITDNGGKSLIMSPLSFQIASSGITFHDSNQNWMLTIGEETSVKKAFVSLNGGNDWKSIAINVADAKWGTDFEQKETIYVLGGTDINKNIQKKRFRLMKTTNFGNNFTVVASNVKSFALSGRFLYASAYTNYEKNKSILRVSTSGGQYWNQAQLPTMIEDQFYRILDMSDGMVFIHVDQPGDTGYGILYTSDADGIIFSESLKKHLYPNYEGVSDFYKVNSLRGVYLTSQLNSDRSIQTVVTFNRGGSWHPVRRPLRSQCPSRTTSCFLQMSYHFSAVKGVPVPMGPLSVSSAVGVILTHGHVGRTLMVDPPDVFISSDGGYNWIQALRGPHLYAIADHGGLLVAVAGGTTSATPVDTLQFSTDEGQTWCTVKFTEQKILVAGLLTDPDSWSMKVVLWGRGSSNNTSWWQTSIIDFQPLLKRQCSEPNDFEDFMAHCETNKKNERQTGCLLGMRETFRKLKRNAWCYLGSNYQIQKSNEHCNCTKDDYECDFGYYRPGNSDRCLENPIFKGAELDVCLNGEEMEIITTGYRKIPGDLCMSGFDPGQHFSKDVKRKCIEGDKTLLGNFHGHATSTLASAILAILVILVMVMVMCMSIFFVKKCRQISSSPLVYRYSRLTQDYINDVTCANADDVSRERECSSEDDEQPATLLVDTSDSTTVELKPKSTVKDFRKPYYLIDESDDELLQ